MKNNSFTALAESLFGILLLIGICACSEGASGDTGTDTIGTTDTSPENTVDGGDGDTELSYTTPPDSVVCEDNSAQVSFGLSAWGSTRDWSTAVDLEYGADLRYLYVYILDGGMDNPDDFRDWYIQLHIDAAESIGAIPFFTFYQLLDIGERQGYTGSEMEIVQAVLTDAEAMNRYFSNFVWFLQVLSERAPEAIVQSEPDSWGFMMWAMGAEGNDDPESISVQVDGSGFADAAGFANDATGLGKALLSMRDKYAPSVRMGWHASNFRVGTRPEVVTEFYSKLGNWDLLVGEAPHNREDDVDWWLEWDDELYQRNLDWFYTVTSTTGLPMILWQIPIGEMDYHLLGDGHYTTKLEDYAAAGIIAFLFDHSNTTGASDPDDYSGFSTQPPADTGISGTFADLRSRLAGYAAEPLPLPEGSICLEK